jgi:hypothetical protein
MTCNSIWATRFDVPMYPGGTSSKRRSIRKQESECRSLPSNQFEDRVPEPPLRGMLDLSTSGDHDMKYFFALVIFSSAVASSNAAAPLNRIRIAQIRTPPECISNCNSVNFSCAQNCGLSGSCVARCTAEAAVCKARCGEPK